MTYWRFLFLLCVAKICGEDGLVDPNCFVIAQSVVFAILEQQWVSVYSFSRRVNAPTAGFSPLPCFNIKSKVQLLCFVILPPSCPQKPCVYLCSPACSIIPRHFTEFLRSHHFCKYQIEVLTSGSVFLADILFCESALFYFSEVCVYTWIPKLRFIYGSPSWIHLKPFFFWCVESFCEDLTLNRFALPCHSLLQKIRFFLLQK